ncbi:uncharacterized protein C8R40DRAFT_1065193 [Lentinula edodes]|uniref:uncharacterized protein n=1 Tax=Lentinula edodes TaxID=5353 RepID=UPI001E8E6C55|nr:uncharacterized protein C8R40DRAFT_1065193 [Lentinula edodes]KAH7881540.1 hypothetical protein C8R40DRAFT_1065193 [Lentinula edodes]
MNSRKRADSPLGDTVSQPGHPKIRLVHISGTDELRQEVITLRAQLANYASQQCTVAKALAVNNDLSSRLIIAEAEIDIKNALVLDLQKQSCTMPGSFDSTAEARYSAMDGAIRRITEALNRSGASKTEHFYDVEEQNSFLSCWSNELQIELQDLTHRYDELLKVHQEVQTELVYMRENATIASDDHVVKQDPDILIEDSLPNLQNTQCPDNSQASVQNDVSKEIIDEYRKYIVKLQMSLRSLTERSESPVDVQSWLLRLVSMKDIELKGLTDINLYSESSLNATVPKSRDIGVMKDISRERVEDSQGQQSKELQVGPPHTGQICENEQLELNEERFSEIKNQHDTYQAKYNVLQEEAAVLEREVHILHSETKELQSTLRANEASSSNKLQNAMQEMKTQQEQQAGFFEAQILALNRQRDLLEVSLKQAWECKNSELKRKCEEFDSLKKEVEALETILSEKDQQLQRNEQHRSEIDSALQSYQSLEQVRATRYRELVKELTATKQEVHLREAQNEKLQLSFEAMEDSLQARLQEQQKAQQSFDARLNDMSRRKDLLEISLKEALKCKSQELEDSQRGYSILREKIQTVQTILNQKEIQIQENELEISRLNASLQRKEEENDYEDSIEVERLREDIEYLEDAVEQLEASRDSLEADLQSEAVKVREREASLLQKEADHAIICKSLEDRLSAFRRDDETKVAKTLLTELQTAYDLQSTQLKDAQQKLIQTSNENRKIKLYQDLVAENEQKFTVAQDQGEKMQCQIMRLEHELSQIRNNDIHPTVSVLQDENLTKSLRIKELQDILDYHKIDHRSTFVDKSCIMQADQYRVPSFSSRDTRLQGELHTTFSAPSSTRGQFDSCTSLSIHQPSSSSRNPSISFPSTVVEMQSPIRSVPSKPSNAKASASSMRGIRFGGLNKSLRNAPIAAELRMTTKREYVLRPSKVLEPSDQLLISKSKHRKLPSQHRKSSIYSKRSQADVDSDDELDTEERKAKQNVGKLHRVHHSKEKARASDDGFTQAQEPIERGNERNDADDGQNGQNAGSAQNDGNGNAGSAQNDGNGNAGSAQNDGNAGSAQNNGNDGGEQDGQTQNNGSTPHRLNRAGGDDGGDDGSDSSDESDDDEGAGGGEGNSNWQIGGGDDVEQDDREESDERTVAESWKLKAVQTHYDESEIRKNINGALAIKNNYEIVDVPSTLPSRLRAFVGGDESVGPKLLGTSLHWRGLSASRMRKSKWNKALVAKLAREARRIQSDCQDGRFGEDVEWKQLFHDRFSHFYKRIEKNRPLQGETNIQREERLLAEYQRRQNSSLRHWKWSNRLRISGCMIDFAQQHKDEQLLHFWTYVHDAVETLGERGMSDEEDSVENVIIDGVPTQQDVKKVKKLWFRNETFEALFQEVDETPKIENTIFTQQGPVAVKRVRSNIIDYRKPPRGYPKGILRTEYLDGLLEFELEDLEFAEREFEILM